MFTRWEPRPVPMPRPELPPCASPRRLSLPEKSDASSFADSCEEGERLPGPRVEDNLEDGTGAVPPKECGSADPGFARILLDLAAEHRGALARLRAELEAAYEERLAGTVKSERRTGRERRLEAGEAGEADEAHNREVSNTASALAIGSGIFTSGGEAGEADEADEAHNREVSNTASALAIGSGIFTSGSERAMPAASVRSAMRSSTWTQSLAEFERSQSEIRLSPFDTASNDTIEEAYDLRSASWMVTARASIKSGGKFAKESVAQLVRTQTFDAMSGMAIILNSVTIGLAANHAMQAAAQGEPPDLVPHVYQLFNVIFTVWFIIELLLRMCSAGLYGFYFKEEWSWNLFDTVVVGSDVIYSILAAAQVSEGSSSVTVQNLTVVRMMRVLRITRAVRIVKLIRFFKELRMMIYSVLRSLSALLWSLVMLTATIYIFSIYFLQVVAIHIYTEQHAPSAVGASATSQRVIGEMFGSLPVAMYTLYQAVSGGLNWGEVGALLIEIDPMHAFVLCFFTFFTTFALLNIITGIFVDTAINSAQSDKDEMILEEMHKTSTAVKEMTRIFETADKDKSGFITLRELERHLQDDEVRAHLSSLGLETDRAKGLFRLLDMDESGQISITEFVFGCRRLKGSAKSIDLATLMLESQRMAEQHRRFFAWSEQQLECLHARSERLELGLERLLGEDLSAPQAG